MMQPVPRLLTQRGELYSSAVSRTTTVIADHDHQLNAIMAEAPWKSVATRKRASLEAKIPSQWRLQKQFVPQEMLPIEDSVKATNFKETNVLGVPRQCGLLSERELYITEDWDVDGLLGELREARLTATEVCTAFCKRAAIAHQVTRCLTDFLFESALVRASELDAFFKHNGKPVGPLHGLPVSIKDTFDIKGVDSTIGMTAHAFKPAKANAPLVDLLVSLGAVIIAKTNIPQTVGALDSVNYIFGRTLNPLNYNMTAGGSSGGEAALVAMRGSMVGFGNDVGGSIRVPAMCTGLYGFKPSAGRIPYGGQVNMSMAGLEKIALQAVAGTLTRSVGDVNTIMKEIVPRAEAFGVDCVPGKWESETPSLPEDKTPRKFTIGVLRKDGLLEPLPPIARVLDEVASKLRKAPGIDVVEIPVPKSLSKCQSLANALLGADGGNRTMDLMESMSEPFVPWLKRLKRGQAKSMEQLSQIQARREEAKQDCYKMWRTASGDKVDAIIHPVAPHPVPGIDKFNATSYCINWVLMDYPAASLPVRNMTEADLELGKEMDAPVLGSWDKKNRELWNSASIDRRVYLNSPLSVQVITPRLHDYDLYKAMGIIDSILQGGVGQAASKL